MDDRAGVYSATVNTSLDAWGGVTPDKNLVPSWGYLEGPWHSQFGADFNTSDKAQPSFFSWVGTPEGTVYKNTSGVSTCVLTGSLTEAYGYCH